MDSGSFGADLLGGGAMKWTQEQQQQAHLDCKEMMLSLHTRLESHPVAIELACQRNELLGALKEALDRMEQFGTKINGREFRPMCSAAIDYAKLAISHAESL
jgi:hypothetical protein